MLDCPCSSRKKYSDCCELVIESGARTALALMRSRYTAYCQGKAEYLLATTHVNTRNQHRLEDLASWSEENDWKKLEVLSTEFGSVSDERGVVEFKAHYVDQSGKAQVHHERSNFLKTDGAWYYVDGGIDPKAVDIMKKISRNDPCSCGSGKKYKKCCG